MSEKFFIKKKTNLKKDVVVVGGGTAGFVAAIAAARNHADVIMIEQEDYLGGTLTGSMPLGLNSLRHQPISSLDAFPDQESASPGEQHVFGIASEFVDKLIELGAAWGIIGKPTIRVLFDPEMTKWVIDQMVKDAGIEVLTYAAVTDIVVENKNIKKIIINKLTEIIEIEARIIIDASGDGDVSVAAGAEYEKGRSSDGAMQPLSLYYIIGGVNLDDTLKYLEKNKEKFGANYVNSVLQLKKDNKPLTLLSFKSKMKEAIENGDYPIAYGAKQSLPEQFLVCRPMVKNGKMVYSITAHNMDMAYRVDATNPFELTKAMIYMRDMAVKMSYFYRKYIPGYQDSYLLQTAPRVGVRETRRIIGDYYITKEEVLSGKKFDDAIGRFGKAIDVHDVDEGARPIFLAEIGGTDGWFHIPYGILVPRGLDNTLVAGRIVSSDRIANGTLRSCVGSMVTGQAAGTSAAISVKKNLKPREIPIRDLQNTLKSQNVLI